ncbi:hypothetical protein LSUE1_G008025, partial [Lachnellula suecica]
MLDLPLADHVSRLVTSLASRPPGRERDVEGEEREVSCDNSEQEDIIEPLEKSSSNGFKVPQQKPARVHCVGASKTKSWRETSPVLYSADLRLPPEVRQSLEEHAQKSRIDTCLGGTDPFDAFELPKNSTTDMALHHWANVFQNTRMVLSPRKAWMKINLSDKTIASVTTYCSAYHFYFIRRMRPPPPCLIQKANAIRNLNNTMRQPGHIPNDYTMVAVAVMTLLECLAGEPRASVIHRKGLQQMVKARGGLENLGFDGGAQRTISWADTACAILMREKPSLSPTLIPTAGESAIAGFSTGDLDSRLLSLTASPYLTKGMLYIYLRLRYLTEFLLRHSFDSFDEYYFSDKIDFIERQILALLHSPRLAESPVVAFVTAFLNAALIYAVEELRECPKWTNVCVALAGRIYSGLQMAELERVRERCPDLLLWVLTLGRSGNSPLGELGRAWYARGIAGLEEGFGVCVPAAVGGL